MVAGEARDDNGETYDEWRARRDAEKATQKAAKQPPQQPKIHLNQEDLLRAIGLAMGEIEKELIGKIGKTLVEIRDEWAIERKSLARRADMDISHRIGRERDGLRAETVRLGREVEKLKDEIEKLKQEMKE